MTRPVGRQQKPPHHKMTVLKCIADCDFVPDSHVESPYETQMFVPVWSSPCVYFWSSWVLDRQQQMPAWDHTGAPTAHSLHLEAYLTSLQTSFTSTPSVWCIEPLVSVHVCMLRESIYSPGSQTLQHRTKLLFTFLRCLFPFDSTGLNEMVLKECESVGSFWIWERNLWQLRLHK